MCSIKETLCGTGDINYVYKRYMMVLSMLLIMHFRDTSSRVPQ